MQVSPDKSGLQDYPSGVAVPAGDDKLTGVTQPGGSATFLGAEPFVFSAHGRFSPHSETAFAAFESLEPPWAAGTANPRYGPLAGRKLFDMSSYGLYKIE